MEAITDRAKRYRAQQCVPPGPRRCAFCGSARNVDVHHLNGDEDDGSPENLIVACRSCNTVIGVTLARAGIGRRTRQYNPGARGAQSLGQWLIAVMSMKGEGPMDTAAAVEMIRATPHARRSEFAREIWARRRERGTDRQEVTRKARTARHEGPG